MTTIKPPRPVNGFGHTAAACARKIRFTDEGAAWKELLTVRRHGGDPGSTTQPYECRYCKGWHLGHRPGTLDENGQVRGVGGRSAVKDRLDKERTQ